MCRILPQIQILSVAGGNPACAKLRFLKIHMICSFLHVERFFSFYQVLRMFCEHCGKRGNCEIPKKLGTCENIQILRQNTSRFLDFGGSMPIRWEKNTGNHSEKILRVRNTRIVASDPDFRCSAGEFGVCEAAFSGRIPMRAAICFHNFPRNGKL